MAEYSAVEQEQRLLDEKDSVELYEGTDYQTRRLDGWRGWWKSPPRWIAYIFVVYTIVSIPIISWTLLSLYRLQQKPYCRLQLSGSTFRKFLTRYSADKQCHRIS